MNKLRLVARVRNNPRDVRFSDLAFGLEAFGFELQGQQGSHRICRHPQVTAYLNLRTDKDAQANPYQVKQDFAVIDESGLAMENAQ
jgi:hypothetical protein